MKNSFLIFLIACSTFSCSYMDNFPSEPPLLAEDWCEAQPCHDFGKLVISQSSSSVIVLLLALYALFIARKFYKESDNSKSLRLWSFGLALGGIGALLAGISYQAFGYVIKCADQSICNWTSWWEIGYLVLTVAAGIFTVLGLAKSFIPGKNQRKLQNWFTLYFAGYLCLIAIGLIFKIRLLLSFEMMVLYLLPIGVFLIILQVRYRNKQRKFYLTAWFILIAVLLIYFAYHRLGITATLWSKGVWFSENDIFHLGMFAWLIYVHLVLVYRIEDYKELE